MKMLLLTLSILHVSLGWQVAFQRWMSRRMADAMVDSCWAPPTPTFDSSDSSADAASVHRNTGWRSMTLRCRVCWHSTRFKVLGFQSDNYAKKIRKTSRF